MDAHTLSTIVISWSIMGFWLIVIWAVMMGDPGASKRSNIIITIIVAILALPVTVAIIVVTALITLIIKYRSKQYGDKLG